MSSSPLILSSPLLTLPIIHQLLTTTPLSDKPLRSSLLSSKLYLLGQQNSTDIETCSTRLELAEMMMEMGKWTESEYELGLVLSSKVIKSARGGQETDTGTEEVKGIKIKALRMMEDVNERLGRNGRARVWRDQRIKLESG
jgi:hypothetical protein